MKKRLIAILIAMTLVLTYVPALAFADNGLAADEQVSYNQGADSWYTGDEKDVSFFGTPVTLTVEVIVDADAEVDFSYQWQMYDDDEDCYADIQGATGTSYVATESGNYKCVVTDTISGDEDMQTFYLYAPYYDDPSGLYYYAISPTEAYVAGEGVSGAVSFPSAIQLSDGKVYTVTTIGNLINSRGVTSVTIPPTVRTIDTYGFDETGITSITIPPTVTTINQWAVGYSYNNDTDVLIPGFTIFGTTGTAAQAYANANGILFRDLAAEAEAARQGTPDGTIAKVKAKKPAAKKTAVTVKWTKLNKKKLKKGKVTNYEVWLCPNKGFGPNDTMMKVVSKGKSSAKFSGLAKKTTYYAKVRAIKYVNGVKMVGKWSSTKKVKTKK